jgi:hypothetical protein
MGIMSFQGKVFGINGEESPYSPMNKHAKPLEEPTPTMASSPPFSRPTITTATSKFLQMTYG